jgi:hypothetical protein
MEDILIMFIFLNKDQYLLLIFKKISFILDNIFKIMDNIYNIGDKVWIKN